MQCNLAIEQYFNVSLFPAKQIKDIYCHFLFASVVTISRPWLSVVVGCPDNVVLENGWFQRHSRDRAVVSCNHSGQTYYITCDHNRWLTDTINCSKGMYPLQNQIHVRNCIA